MSIIRRASEMSIIRRASEMSIIRRASVPKTVGAEFLLELPEVTYTGWLKKECDNKLLRDYSKKYGIIYKGSLYLYENETSAKATHVYNTKNIRLECKRENGQWGFSIENSDEKFKGRKNTTFIVGSEHEMMSWVNHLTAEKDVSTKVLTNPTSTDVRYITIPDRKGPSLPLYESLPENEEIEHYQTPRSNLPVSKCDSLPPISALDTDYYQKPRSHTLPTNQPEVPIRSPSQSPHLQSPVEQTRPIPKPRPRSVYRAPLPPETNRSYEDCHPTIKKDEIPEKIVHEEYIDMESLKVDGGGDCRTSSPKKENKNDYCEIDNVVWPVDEKDKNVLPETVFKFQFDREKSRKTLDEDGTPGVYLIRKKDNGVKVLSAFLLGAVRHYIIYQEEDKLFLRKEDEPRFSQLPDLIRHYMRFNLPTCHARLETPYKG